MRGLVLSLRSLIWLVSIFECAIRLETYRTPGSERARAAKTAGATLAEAGKINESLMYLGQCLQMQSDNHDNTKVCPPSCTLLLILMTRSPLWFRSDNAN